jgi:hypothetical protein
MQFSPTSRYFIYGPNILLSTIFLNALRLCTSINVRVQVLHPDRTTDKAVVLYIIIFTFIDCRHGLVVRVSGYRSRGPGLDSQHYQII